MLFKVSKLVSFFLEITIKSGQENCDWQNNVRIKNNTLFYNGIRRGLYYSLDTADSFFFFNIHIILLYNIAIMKHVTTIYNYLNVINTRYEK